MTSFYHWFGIREMHERNSEWNHFICMGMHEIHLRYVEILMALLVHSTKDCTIFLSYWILGTMYVSMWTSCYWLFCVVRYRAKQWSHCGEMLCLNFNHFFKRFMHSVTTYARKWGLAIWATQITTSKRLTGLVWLAALWSNGLSLR